MTSNNIQIKWIKIKQSIPLENDLYELKDKIMKRFNNNEAVKFIFTIRPEQNSKEYLIEANISVPKHPMIVANIKTIDRNHNQAIAKLSERLDSQLNKLKIKTHKFLSKMKTKNYGGESQFNQHIIKK